MLNIDGMLPHGMDMAISMNETPIKPKHDGKRFFTIHLTSCKCQFYNMLPAVFRQLYLPPVSPPQGRRGFREWKSVLCIVYLSNFASYKKYSK